MVFPLNSNKDISFPYESNKVNSGTLFPVLTAANVVFIKILSKEIKINWINFI
jgi:hypothetical protein